MTEVLGNKVLSVKPEALTLLAEQAFIDISHLLRPAHLQVSCVTMLYYYHHQEVMFVGVFICLQN